MSLSWLRAIAGIAAFFVVLAIGINFTGSLDATADLKDAANKVVAIVIVGLVVGLIVYAAIEYRQTGRLESITSQFDTRTIVLIPIAIAINIILGQTVAAALKVPVYLDSIGTILIGVLAGPIAGAVTGGLANLIWTYVLPAPFHSDYAAPFFIVAVEIGLLAGVFGRLGFFRSRPNTPPGRLFVGALVVAAVVAVIAIYGFLPYYAKGVTFFAPPNPAIPPPDTIFVIIGWLVAALLIAAVVGLVALLFIRRDLGAAYVFVAGLTCGIVSAIISAPISTVFFSGVTGSGTDLLVAAFQKAGDELGSAVLKQGLLSDPIDKTLTFFVVFAILGALSRRFVARFPQGEAAVGLEGE
jgi:energy-coupling factor transport system substrate-specific component